MPYPPFLAPVPGGSTAGRPSGTIAGGRLKTEPGTDGSRTGFYQYRPDGLRTSHTINGRKTRFVASDAGRMQEVRDGQLSPQYQASVSGEIYWVDPNPAYPNPANTYYASVDAALQAVFAEHGPQPPTDPPIIYIEAPNPYTADLIIEQKLVYDGQPELEALHYDGSNGK